MSCSNFIAKRYGDRHLDLMTAQIELSNVAQRPARMRHAQTLGQQQPEFVAQPLAPVAQPRALVREGVLEELLASKELEVWVLDSTLAHIFVR